MKLKIAKIVGISPEKEVFLEGENWAAPVNLGKSFQRKNDALMRIADYKYVFLAVEDDGKVVDVLPGPF